MKRKEFVVVKGLSLKELLEKAKALKIEVANLVMDKNMKKIKNVKIIAGKRKDIAQILTVVGQTKLLSELEAKIAKKGDTK